MSVKVPRRRGINLFYHIQDATLYIPYSNASYEVYSMFYWMDFFSFAILWEEDYFVRNLDIFTSLRLT